MIDLGKGLCPRIVCAAGHVALAQPGLAGGCGEQPSYLLPQVGQALGPGRTRQHVTGDLDYNLIPIRLSNAPTLDLCYSLQSRQSRGNQQCCCGYGLQLWFAAVRFLATTRCVPD